METERERERKRKKEDSRVKNISRLGRREERERWNHFRGLREGGGRGEVKLFNSRPPELNINISLC